MVGLVLSRTLAMPGDPASWDTALLSSLLHLAHPYAFAPFRHATVDSERLGKHKLPMPEIGLGRRGFCQRHSCCQPLFKRKKQKLALARVRSRPSHSLL